MARIFAKCLNCVHGPTDEPCLECDICPGDRRPGRTSTSSRSTAASNNGVEAVRELRQNAGLRPSRGAVQNLLHRRSAYALDGAAFNALLKTLEEPPEHVNFFFATTEANKIPITVSLAACQYATDFAGISPDQIIATLSDITCAPGGVEAGPDALRARAPVARRARCADAQSLLEQLLSSGRPGLDGQAYFVHQVLGIAADDRVAPRPGRRPGRPRPRARRLRLLEQAVDSGVQPVDVLNGALLEFQVRDVMVLAAGRR